MGRWTYGYDDLEGFGGADREVAHCPGLIFKSANAWSHRIDDDAVSKRENIGQLKSAGSERSLVGDFDEVAQIATPGTGNHGIIGPGSGDDQIDSGNDGGGFGDRVVGAVAVGS